MREPNIILKVAELKRLVILIFKGKKIILLNSRIIEECFSSIYI